MSLIAKQDAHELFQIFSFLFSFDCFGGLSRGGWAEQKQNLEYFTHKKN